MTRRDAARYSHVKLSSNPKESAAAKPTLCAPGDSFLAVICTYIVAESEEDYPAIIERKERETSSAYPLCPDCREVMEKKIAKITETLTVQ